ncbi:MAG: betaine-aldehyde dehydrogenase [Sediminispirochaetaceae bacterium]
MNKRTEYKGKTKMYIDGNWTESVSGGKREILYPCTGEVITEVAEGDAEDARLAVIAARRAFDEGPWPETPAAERGRLIEELADKVEENREELARLESLDTGKTVEESRWDMDDIAGIFRYFGQLADKEGGEIIQSPVPNTTSRLVREPIGVAAQISPWNYPLLQASWKIAPALAAGCTIVMKPSEITPFTTIRITELAEEVGFPKGVINLVLGAGNTVGTEMTVNTGVDMVSFTGGIATGKKILKAASDTVKKVSLELGGKNPNIIFADAEFDTALDFALNGVFFHAGQICSAGSRILVETSIHDRFVEALKERIAGIRLGDAFDPGTRMGPLISAEHRDKVESYIELAREEGAQIVLGGGRPENPPHSGGFYFEPTLITGVHNSMRLAKEEIFGPVITVESFDSEAQAVEWANDTIYGLSAGVWTADQSRAERVSSALRAGTVWINDFNVYFVQAPWGGYKQSGLGRELGKIGLEEYTEVKHIYQNHANEAIGWFGPK